METETGSNFGKRRLQATGRSLLQQYTNFEMQEDQNIDEAWQELSTIARRAVAISPQFKEIKTEKRMIQQLLAGLPKAFYAVRDGIDTRADLEPQDILCILREKQEQMLQKETALFTKRGTNNSGRSQHRQSEQFTYYLYKGNYSIKDCLDLSTAKQAVKQKLKKLRSLLRRKSSLLKDNLEKMVERLI